MFITVYLLSSQMKLINATEAWGLDDNGYLQGLVKGADEEDSKSNSDDDEEDEEDEEDDKDGSGSDISMQWGSMNGANRSEDVV
jgi:hypothetical protein